jgi:hypothetical protein
MIDKSVLRMHQSGACAVEKIINTSVARKKNPHRSGASKLMRKKPAIFRAPAFELVF